MRAKTLNELKALCEYFFSDPKDFDENAIIKRWKDKSVNKLMCKVGHAVAYYGQNKKLVEKAHINNRKRVR